MVNRKWVAGAVLAAFLTVGVGTATPQAYAGERAPAIQITTIDTVELAKHHRDRGPKKISHHRGHRPPDHRPPHHRPPHPRPHHSHDSGNAIVGGIIGGIIGGILVNGSN